MFKNLEGVMLWDASSGINNVNRGIDYLQAVKSAFKGQQSSLVDLKQGSK
jgi:hypothetical protein